MIPILIKGNGSTPHPGGGLAGVQDRRPVLVPIETENQREQLRIASAWDGHPEMLLPTHVMLNAEREIVGCTSLGAVVMANSWFSTEKLRPRDTVHLLGLIENVARAVGYKAICLPGPESSPMYKHMVDRFGYTCLGQLGLFAKQLR